MKPINKCLMVELQSHQTSSSGLELSVKEEDKKLRAGKILALPSNLEGFEELSVGDIIVFGEYSYDTLLFEGNSYVFLDINDVIAKIC